MQISQRMLKARLIASVVALGCAVGLSSVYAEGVGNAQVIRLSAPVAEDALSETFGRQWDRSRDVLELGEVLSDVDGFVDQPLVIRTRIAKVCQKKGCFFIAQAGPQAVRVSFRDYGFFIPTDASGKTVELAGELVRKELSPEQAAHFNSDAGGDTTLPAGEVVEIVADGIRIPRQAS